MKCFSPCCYAHLSAHAPITEAVCPTCKRVCVPIPGGTGGNEKHVWADVHCVEGDHVQLVVQVCQATQEARLVRRTRIDAMRGRVALGDEPIAADRKQMVQLCSVMLKLLSKHNYIHKEWIEMFSNPPPETEE